MAYHLPPASSTDRPESRKPNAENHPGIGTIGQSTTPSATACRHSAIIGASISSTMPAMIEADCGARGRSGRLPSMGKSRVRIAANGASIAFFGKQDLAAVASPPPNRHQDRHQARSGRPVRLDPSACQNQLTIDHHIGVLAVSDSVDSPIDIRQ